VLQVPATLRSFINSSDENEKIVLQLVPLKDLWKFTSDSKALCALSLYEGLKREGKIPEKE
jgi:hypothetical protein